MSNFLKHLLFIFRSGVGLFFNFAYDPWQIFFFWNVDFHGTPCCELVLHPAKIIFSAWCISRQLSCPIRQSYHGTHPPTITQQSTTVLPDWAWVAVWRHVGTSVAWESPTKGTSVGTGSSCANRLSVTSLPWALPKRKLTALLANSPIWWAHITNPQPTYSTHQEKSLPAVDR